MARLLKEVLEMARDAIRLYIEILIEDGVFSPCGRRAHGKWAHVEANA
jgi:predicted RNase H-like HicB family nuclease